MRGAEFPEAKRIVKQLTRYLQSDIEALSKGSDFLSFPMIEVSDVFSLLKHVESLFKDEPVLLDIASPLVIVGDLHGHYLDLLRIFKEYGMPDTRRYLFLGDFVDRGEFSIETILMLFSLKVLHPSNVFLVRGNHEFDSLCNRCGFYGELLDVYSNVELYPRFMDVFSYLPITAIVDKKILCVHGGLGPNIYSLHQLRAITRPITDFEDELVLNSLLWSDPKDTVDNYEDSSRGSGYLFGESAVNEFIVGQRLTTIVRAHECVLGGYEEHFGGKLITVFSASNYCGLVGNSSAVLEVECGKIAPKVLPPLGYLKKPKVCYRAPQSSLAKANVPKQLQSLRGANPTGSLQSISSIQNFFTTPQIRSATHKEPLINRKGSMAVIQSPKTDKKFRNSLLVF